LASQAVTNRRPPQDLPRGARRATPSAGTMVIIGVPVVLVLTLLWQMAGSLLRTEIVARDAVAISTVSLEADPLGSRIDFVLVDRTGHDASVNGDVTIALREPDGTIWQSTRHVTSGAFKTLTQPGLLQGRMGYSLTVPSTDWLRTPRRGGGATINVVVQPADGPPFSTVAEQRFP
jgi:hypothetical protein